MFPVYLPAVWRSDCGEPGHLAAEVVLPKGGGRDQGGGGGAGVRARLQRPRDPGRVRRTGLGEGQTDGARGGSEDRTQPQWDSVSIRWMGLSEA